MSHFDLINFSFVIPYSNIRLFKELKLICYKSSLKNLSNYRKLYKHRVIIIESSHLILMITKNISDKN